MKRQNKIIKIKLNECIIKYKAVFLKNDKKHLVLHALMKQTNTNSRTYNKIINNCNTISEQ